MNIYLYVLILTMLNVQVYAAQQQTRQERQNQRLQEHRKEQTKKATDKKEKEQQIKEAKKELKKARKELKQLEKRSEANIQALEQSNWIAEEQRQRHLNIAQRQANGETISPEDRNHANQVGTQRERKERLQRRERMYDLAHAEGEAQRNLQAATARLEALTQPQSAIARNNE